MQLRRIICFGRSASTRRILYLVDGLLEILECFGWMLLGNFLSVVRELLFAPKGSDATKLLWIFIGDDDLHHFPGSNRTQEGLLLVQTQTGAYLSELIPPTWSQSITGRRKQHSKLEFSCSHIDTSYFFFTR